MALAATEAPPASRDENGILTYLGRSDDVFKSSGYRLSPFELESVLIDHPAVAEAAVVSSPDALRLSVPKTISGKIRRVALRANEEARHGTDSAREPAPGQDSTANKEYRDSDFPN